MRTLGWAVISISLVYGCYGETAEDRASLLKTTATIRDAFGRGDVNAIAALHDPAVVKYFGGSNVVLGRENLIKGLSETFKNAKMEFIENKIEARCFTGTQ